MAGFGAGGMINDVAFFSFAAEDFPGGMIVLCCGGEARSRPFMAQGC